jgi:hypothetical protein
MAKSQTVQAVQVQLGLLIVVCRVRTNRLEFLHCAISSPNRILIYPWITPRDSKAKDHVSQSDFLPKVSPFEAIVNNQSNSTLEERQLIKTNRNKTD